MSLHGAAILITGARVVQTVVVFLLAMLLVRVLAVPEYGTYKQVHGLASLLPIAVSVPLGKALIYFLPRVRRKGVLLRRAALWLLGLSALVLLAFGLLPGALELFDPGDPRLAEHRFLIGLTLAVAFPYTIAEEVMLARGRRAAVAWMLLGVSVALLLGVGTAALVSPLDHVFLWCLRAVFLGYVVQAGCALWWMLRTPDAEEEGEGSMDLPSRSELLHFLLPVAGGTLLQAAGSRFDFLLVPLLFPMDVYPEVKALFTQGAMEIPILSAIPFTVLALLAPEIATHHARGERNELAWLWRRTLRPLTILAAVGVGGAQVVIEDLWVEVFTEEYLPSVQVFRWYALVVVLRIFLPQTLLENTGAARQTLVCAVALLVGSVLLTVVLYPLYVAFGWDAWVAPTAAVVLANFGANWWLGGHLAKRHLGLEWSDLFDWLWFLRLVVAVGLATAVGLVGLELWVPSDWNRVLRAAVGGVSFLVTVAVVAPLVGAVTADDARQAITLAPGGAKLLKLVGLADR